MATTPAEKKEVKLKYKLPPTLGAAIDLMYKVREERQKLTAKAEDEKRQEDLLETAILEKFKKSELEGAKGKRAQASVSIKEVPTLEVDTDFYRHLAKHPEDFDLLQRRLSSTAVRERWKVGKSIPGVGKFTKVGLSLTKR